MNSPLKKLDQSVFDGLPPEYKFAAVDSTGLAFAYEQRPRRYVAGIGGFGFDGMCRSIFGNFDATDWQNSLIEREEIAAAQKPQPLSRGDLVEYDGDICVVYQKCGDVDGIGYQVVSLTGSGGHWYVTHDELTRIGSIRKKIKRLKAQMEDAK